MPVTPSSATIRARTLRPPTVHVALPLAALGVGLVALRRWSLRFGSTPDEVASSMPGDDQIPHPNLESTRAITIAADPEQVWPWIAQLGQGRGGFYSYTALENLVGADITNAEEIVAAWQEPAVGGQIDLAPGMALDVVVVDPGRALVLRGGVPVADKSSPFDFSWAFELREVTDGTCRLVVRERYGYTRRWAALMVEPTELVSFLMTQRMLRGIRDRAERAPGDHPRPAAAVSASDQRLESTS